MPKFRKKPVEIEAWQFAEEVPIIPKPQWLMDAINNGSVYYQGGGEPYFTIETLEGHMCAGYGDWIIQGVAGEIYPCKDPIFKATYEVA